MEMIVLDTDRNVIAIIDVFESLIWTDRYAGYGDFEVYTTVNSEYIRTFAIDNYIRINESEHLMIIESLEILSNVDGGNKLVVKGLSLIHI